MNSIPVSLILAGFLAPAAVHAQMPETEPMEPKLDKNERVERQRRFEEVWSAADSDGNEHLSRQEFQTMKRVQGLPEAQRESIFNRLDKDGDGKIAKDELRHSGMAGEGHRPPRYWLRELDVDQSRGVSLEEFKAGRMFQKFSAEKQVELFRRLDTDGDGEITPKDAPKTPGQEGKDPSRKGPGRPGPLPDPARMIKRLDSNGDNSVSFEEFRAEKPMSEWSEDEQEDRFEEMDRNQDHKLTLGDFPPPPEGPEEEDPPPATVPEPK